MNPRIKSDVPIIPFEQFGKTIKMYFNGYSHGYTQIVIHNIDTQKEYSVIDIKNQLEYDEDLHLYYILVEDVDPGIYEIYAANSDKSVCSDSINFVMSGDSKNELMKIVINFANTSNDTQDIYVSVQKQINDDTNLISFL